MEGLGDTCFSAKSVLLRTKDSEAPLRGKSALASAHDLRSSAAYDKSERHRGTAKTNEDPSEEQPTLVR